MADTILGSRFNLWYKPMFNLNFQSKKKGSSNNFSYGVVYFGTSITVVLAPPKSIPCPACSHPSRCSTIPSVCFMAVLHNGQGIEDVRSKWHPSCSHAKTKEKKKRGGGLKRNGIGLTPSPTTGWVGLGALNRRCPSTLMRFFA